MTAKQQRFVEEYLIDLNTTQAAIRAGYSPSTAKEQGYQMLHKPSLSNIVKRKMEERSRRTGVNADRLIQELARIAFANLADLIDLDSGKMLDKISPDDLAAVEFVKVKTAFLGENRNSLEREVKLYDKLKALDLLARHLGMYGNASRAITNGNVDNMGVILIPEIKVGVEFKSSKSSVEKPANRDKQVL